MCVYVHVRVIRRSITDLRGKNYRTQLAGYTVPIHSQPHEQKAGSYTQRVTAIGNFAALTYVKVHAEAIPLIELYSYSRKSRRLASCVTQRGPTEHLRTGALSNN